MPKVTGISPYFQNYAVSEDPLNSSALLITSATVTLRAVSRTERWIDLCYCSAQHRAGKVICRSSLSLASNG